MSSSPVKLYVYDLSNGLAKQLSRQLTGKQIDGIWHSSVVVFSQEFAYGQGIIITPPGQSHFGTPLQILDMGETFIDKDTFNEYIHAMKEHYTADKYHLLEFNCNSFTNDVIGFLTGKSIPSFIEDLPTDFLSTPFGAALRPTIDAMYRRSSPGAPRAAAPSPIPASSTSTDSHLAASVLQSVAAQASAPNLANGIGSTRTESLSGPVHVITNPASFRSFLNTHKAAVAFFTSSTCGPCRAIEPFFIKLAEDKSMKSRGSSLKGAAFAKIDIGVGLGHTLASEYRVRATPTFLFFLDGVKIQEIRGANSTELKTQVDLLLFQAYPPHPHTKLSLPLIQKISFNPILFTQVPSVDAVTTKLNSFIDSATWPASASSSKAEVKAVISNSIAPYLKGRQTNGSVPNQSVSATTAMLAAWSQATTLLVDSIPVEKLFPLVDLWRLFVLDPTAGTWTASLPSFDKHPLNLLLTVAHKQKMACPRNYLLTVLRLSSNVFANPPIAQRVVTGAYKERLTELVVQSLLHDDTGVKNASASLIFNLAVVIQSKRMRSMRGEEVKGQGTVEIDEDEDWELEIITAVIEALKREKDNEEIVHRLTAALAFIIRLSPFLESLQPLLQVLQCREMLQNKVRENGWRNVEVKKLVEEVAILCDTPSMSIDQAALVNNKKLFDLYARKLCSDDANTFIEITEKLAFWLNNEKAYYDQARPEIVKLLLVAQSTLRRALNVPDPTIPFHVLRYVAHPSVQSYIKLIEVVNRFAHLFVEQDLGIHIRYLVSSVIPPTLPPVFVKIQSPQSNQEQADPSSTGLSNHQPSSSAMPSTSYIPTPPVESESPATMDPAVPPQKGVVQKVKKKRRNLDYLIDVDLRKFRETVAATQTQTAVVEPANQESLHEPDADKCKVDVSEPSEAILPPNLSRKSSLSFPAISLGRAEEPLPVLKTAAAEVKVASDQKPYSPIVQDQGGRNGPDILTTQMALEGTSNLKGDITDPTTQSLGIQDAVTVAVSESSGHVKSTPTDNECEATIVSPQRISEYVAPGNTNVVLSEPIDGAETHMLGVGDEVNGSTDVDMIVAEEHDQELVQRKHQNLNDGDIHDELPTQTTVLEKIEELHTKLSLYVSQPPLDHELKLSIEDRLSNEEYLERQEIRTLLGLDDERNGVCAEMDTTDERPEELLVEVPQPLYSIPDEDGILRNLFERIKVPAFVKGLRNPGRVTINFNIKPAVHLALSRWTEKSCHSASGINEAMCITLGCYKATEAALSAIANNNEQGWKEFISTNRSSWPKTGGLQLILTAQQHYNLPLSPPIIVSSDGLLDITHLLVAGPNSFELRSHRDMSKYVFALAVHPPTPSQLSLHYEYCKKEQDWQKWITSLSRPFNVNSLPTFAR